MDSKIARKKPSKRGATPPIDVEAFIASLDHPFKEEILALRRIILDADPSIAEEIKWNAPSFRTSESFATFHLRARDGVRVILHFGAKKRDKQFPRTRIADPGSLLDWLSGDRASVRMADMKEIRATRTLFSNVIQQWIKCV